MSYVMAAPQFMDAAATDLAAIGSALGAAHTAAATPTRALLPAAADEVSAGIAQLFSQHADDYQKLAGQAASFHRQFIQQLTASANAYASAEAASASLLRPAAASAASTANAAATGIRWYDQLNIAINNYIDSVIQTIGFLFFLPFYHRPVISSALGNTFGLFPRRLPHRRFLPLRAEHHLRLELPVMLAEELPDGVGGIERRRRLGKVDQLFQQWFGLPAGPLMTGSGNRDQLHGAPVGAGRGLRRHNPHRG